MKRTFGTLVNFVILSAASLQAAEVVLVKNQPVEPVDMQKRATELKNLKWGMFICWSFSTFTGYPILPPHAGGANWFQHKLIEFPPIEARYVRLNIVKATATFYIGEFSVFPPAKNNQ